MSDKMYSVALKFVNPSQFPPFLQKYDVKCDQTFTEVLKLDKGSSFIYKGKRYHFIYLGEVKVYEPLLAFSKWCDPLFQPCV